MLRAFAEQEQSPVIDNLMKEATKEPQTEIADREINAYRYFLSEFGIRHTQQPKMHGALAREVRQDEDFGPLNKILSKITHRPAFRLHQVPCRAVLMK